ncbi:hypothetical protein F2Q68_00009790 [Brassica cretica]|uniref:Uncharacterized protein n=1 Tax=Brassica cretica TaxID=69181 RepID=A0A8S9KWC1_BRACR|nr:hypothetical protein F2Q68_00009790 [Brassica cretica]
MEAGTQSVPLSGTRGSGSCLEAGGNDTGIFFPNRLPLISRFRHRSRGITCALKSAEVAYSQQASLRQDPVPLILLSWVPLKPELILNPVIPRLDYPSGKDTVEQLLVLPHERREVSFLVSDEARDRCSIRGVMSGSRGNEAVAEYKKALEAMSKVSALKSSPPVSDNWSKVLANLNAKVFPLTPACLASDVDSSMAIRSLQGDLLQAASQLFLLGERMEDKTTAQAEADALTAKLGEEKDAVLAKGREIKALKLDVQNQEEALERVARKNASLQKLLEDKEEDICELRYTTEVFDDEKAMAVNGAKVVTSWELMREWLHRQTDSWEPAAALEQYKTVKTTEAEFLGLPVPCFEDEPQVPERGGAPESADDPLTN